METYSRVLGAFLGAALGDAMGANTESKTPAMILARYGRYLDDLLPGRPASSPTTFPWPGSRPRCCWSTAGR